MDNVREVMNKAILVQVSFWRPGDTRRQSDDSDTGTVKVRKLFPTRAFAEHEGVRNRWNLYAESRLLPFPVRGVRMSVIDHWPGILKKIVELQLDWDCATDAFVKGYDEIKAQAREQFGDNYQESDYPTVEELPNMFGLEYRVLRYPMPDKSQQELYDDPATYDAECERVTADVESIIQDATQAIQDQFAGHVNHLLEKLSPDNKQRLHERAITNFREFLDWFDAINQLIQDDNLAQYVDWSKGTLGNITAKELREDEVLRESVTEGFGQVLDYLNGTEPTADTSDDVEETEEGQ